MRGLLPQRLRDALYHLREAGRWMIPEAMSRPGFLFMGVRRRRVLFDFVEERRRQVARGQETWLETSHPVALPRIVWIFWGQGEDAAPPVVRRAIASWRDRNEGWDVRVLSEESVARMDAMPVRGGRGLTPFSDLLRVSLLARHGGVWVDATLYCHRPLDAWLPALTTGGGLMMSHSGPDRLVDVWLIAARPGSRLMAALARELEATPLTRDGAFGFYFTLHYLVDWLVRRQADVREEFQRMTLIPARPALLLWSALVGASPREAARETVQAGYPVSKLTWRSTVSAADLGEMIDHVEMRS